MLGIALLGRQRYLNSIRREVFLDRQHREDETKFRTLFESSRDAIMLRDRTTLIDCNRAALELFGFATKEQFMAKRPGELSPPRQPDGTDSQVTARDQIEAAYAQGGQFFRWLFQRQDETVFPAEVQLSRVELDKKVLLQALVRDIGSRKRVEEALRRSEGFLDSIIEHSPHAMWISDDQGTLIRLNQACRDLLHLTDDEVVGKYNMLRDNLVEEQGHMPLVRRVFEKGETVKFAVTYDSSRLRHLQLRDTAFAVLDVTVSPVLDANGRVVYGIIQHVDITERKQMEQALREREARYAALFEHNPIETIVVDLDGRIQAFNRAKRESGDRLPQIGEVMYRDYAGKHTTDMHGELMHCIQSGELRRYPEQLYGERSLTIAIAPFANGAIITSQDITEHKRAEEALKESESRLRIIIESSKDGIILFDGKTRKVMFGNAAMAELLGCSREDLVGRSVPFRHPTEERESIEQEFQKHVRGEISFSAGIPVFRDDGSVFEADISSRLLMLEGRSYISAFFRDITERKRAEDSLRNSEEHLRMICENAPVMMDAFDKEGRCTMWNKECEKTFGWTIEEINSHDEPLSLFYPDPKIRERVMETITSKPERIFREWHPQTKDGRVLTCMWANFVLPDKSVMNLGYDVTERRQTEQSLRKLSLHASRAEDAERRRIARELHDSTGQKLAALSMTVGLLQDTTAAPDGKTDKMFADCLALIEQCVQEIRTISYLLHPPLLDELGLAAAIGDYLEGFSKRSGLQVALDAPPGLDRLPDEVELALFRVVQESLGNIHHHAGASTARIRLACDAEQVTLEVSDQGRGMSAETLRAIQAGHGPAGVGIAGMRERLRLLGGQSEITSGQRGTTLRAIIPRPQKTT
jgi:PAS domain S-box-containing protein